MTLSASSAGAQVQPLVGELRSHMPYGTARKKERTHTPPHTLSMYEGEKKGGLDEKIITLLNNTAFSFECFTYINPHPYSYNRE